MVKLWITAPNDGTPPLYAFLDTLEEKQRQKIFSLLATLRENGDLLFLVPFIKRHRRDTMQALDASLRLLAQCRDGSCSIQELSIKSYTNGGNAT